MEILGGEVLPPFSSSVEDIASRNGYQVAFSSLPVEISPLPSIFLHGPFCCFFIMNFHFMLMQDTFRALAPVGIQVF